MNVYMDDIRHGPDVGAWKDGMLDWMDWIIVRSVENTKSLLKMGVVDKLSLDHDMGSVINGYDLVKWMVDTGNWPKGVITIHSENIIGSKNMQALIDNAKKHGLYAT